MLVTSWHIFMQALHEGIKALHLVLEVPVWLLVLKQTNDSITPSIQIFRAHAPSMNKPQHSNLQHSNHTSPFITRRSVSE